MLPTLYSLLSSLCSLPASSVQSRGNGDNPSRDGTGRERGGKGGSGVEKGKKEEKNLLTCSLHVLGGRETKGNGNKRERVGESFKGLTGRTNDQRGWIKFDRTSHLSPSPSLLRKAISSATSMNFASQPPYNGNPNFLYALLAPVAQDISYRHQKIVGTGG